jgi:hypothetical protein
VTAKELRKCAELLRKASPDIDAIAEHIECAAAEIERLRAANRLIASTERGNVWHWQGDGHDFPDSLVCPVVIDCEVFRGMLKECAK